MQIDSRSIGQRIEFTGSGAEYFRIWLVNIALTFLTLGVYSAWAKVRREQYFARNTRLAGSSFDYHGKPRSILIGRLIALALLGSVGLGRYLPEWLAGLALLIFIVLLPFLMQRSMRFRLSNTSWRGLRFRFAGTVKRAYRLFGKHALVIIMALGVIAAMMPLMSVRTHGAGVPIAASIVVAALLASLPAALWFMLVSLRRYVMSHAAFGDLRFSLDAPRREFISLFLRVAGFGLLSYLSAIAFAALIAAALNMAPSNDFERIHESMFGELFTGVLLSAAAYIAFLLTRAYSSARMQRLVWNRTTLGPHRFVCDLRARALCGLTIKNWLLTALSLGYYRPYAAIATARLRVTSIRLVTIGEFEAHAAQAVDAGMAAGEELFSALDLDLAI